jgi:pimeloyl-ACP methyl ester carboxylesterase
MNSSSNSTPQQTPPFERPPEWFERCLETPATTVRVQVSDTEIEVLRWGNTDRQALVFLHGFAAHAHWWDPIAPQFLDQYQCVAVTFSGMGNSGWREEYSMARYVEDVVAVIRELDLARSAKPILVGHSMGGAVAAHATGLHGELLAGTIIVDMRIKTPKRGLPEAPFFLKMRPHKVFAEREDAIARFRFVPEEEDIAPCLRRYIAGHSLVGQADGSAGWSWSYDPFIFRTLDVGDQLSLYDKPWRIALVWGEKSSLVLNEHKVEARKFFGQSIIVEIPDAGHHVILAQPVAFVATVRTILAAWALMLPL